MLNKFFCSLEEFYKGLMRKMKIFRSVFDVSGRIVFVEEIFIIDIKFGWKKGMKIIFVEKGNG